MSDGVWYQLINDISHDETAAVISDNIVLLLMITFLHSQCPPSHQIYCDMCGEQGGVRESPIQTPALMVSGLRQCLSVSADSVGATIDVSVQCPSPWIQSVVKN